MNNMNLCPEVLAFVSKDNGISQNDVKTLYAKMVEDTKKAMEGMTYADLTSGAGINSICRMVKNGGRSELKAIKDAKKEKRKRNKNNKKSKK
tara:strand:+ start:1203 stop:1478 length:276 start_codon:yes stop_codon:yes gene_type:complete